MSYLKRFLSIATLWLFGLNCSFADVIYDVTGGSINVQNQNNGDYGQSFNTAAVRTITNITLYNATRYNGSGAYTINLFASTLNGSNLYVPSGSALRSISGTLAADGNLVLSNLNWGVNSNTVYILAMAASGSSTSTFGTRYNNAAQTVGNGFVAGYAGMNFTVSTTAGGAATGAWLTAKIEGTSAVPEPGTLLLSGIAAACGGGGVWWKRRKRKAVEGEQAVGETVV